MQFGCTVDSKQAGLSYKHHTARFNFFWAAFRSSLSVKYGLLVQTGKRSSRQFLIFLLFENDSSESRLQDTHCVPCRYLVTCATFSVILFSFRLFLFLFYSFVLHMPSVAPGFEFMINSISCQCVYGLTRAACVVFWIHSITP